MQNVYIVLCQFPTSDGIAGAYVTPYSYQTKKQAKNYIDKKIKEQLSKGKEFSSYHKGNDFIILDNNVPITFYSIELTKLRKKKV